MSLKTAQTSISAKSQWDARHILFMLVDEKIIASEMTRCVQVKVRWVPCAVGYFSLTSQLLFAK